MNTYDAIKTRRSVRSYSSQPVDDATLDRILEAARLAPSASNRQEWRFVVVRDPATRMKMMAAASGQKFVAQAPVVIACCAETDGHIMRCGQACYPIDVAIAIDHITLAAVEEGLGTCWIGAFSEPDVKAILDIPNRIRVVELLTLGHSADEPRAKNRKPLNEIACHEKWTLG